ncbi:unnamed protein product [Camellia sinensis]
MDSEYDNGEEDDLLYEANIDKNVERGGFHERGKGNNGLIPALAEVIPNAEHRFCVRHMYNNFQDNHKGVLLKDLLWSAAKASYVQQFEFHMQEVKEVDKDAFKWLAEKPASFWSRSHFITHSKMQRMKEVMRAYQGPLCPNIQKKLEKKKVESSSCIAMWSGASTYQINCFNGQQFVVDLEAHTCSCRKWDLSGIPCPHSISAIYFKHENPKDYASMNTDSNTADATPISSPVVIGSQQSAN